MKKLTMIFALLIISVAMFGQTKMNEKDAVQKSHIDFTKEYLFFTISGMIEIDGHTFKNDTCKVPIIYQANLDGIKIVRGNEEFEHRTCEVKGCKVIHLILKELTLTSPSFRWPPVLTLPNDNFIPVNDNLHIIQN